jgi:glycosyltransferase involved in cell wall biosynthesis
MNNVSVIIACRNESQHINKVLTSLLEQTVKPKEVAIVDDASTDNTFEVINEFSRPGWVIVKRKNNDERYSSIVNAMKIATTLLKEDFEYIMVLDGDTVLESRYIEKILEKFKIFPDLGIAGGTLIFKDTNKTVSMIDTSEVFGSNRIYSRKCWFDINEGKIMKVNSFAWDPEHSMRAKNRRYKVKRFDEVISYTMRLPSLKVPSFSKGRLSYCFGYSFFKVLFFAIFSRDLSFLAGYITASIIKENQIDNKKNISMLKIKYDIEYIEKIRSKFFTNIKSGN